MRQIKIDIDNILELIASAEDWGFYHDVLFDAFSDMIGKKLSFTEIENYAKSIEEMEEYSHEDYLQIIQRLLQFKNKYCD